MFYSSKTLITIYVLFYFSSRKRKKRQGELHFITYPFLFHYFSFSSFFLLFKLEIRGITMSRALRY
jgi:hypothetical protein